MSISAVISSAFLNLFLSALLALVYTPRLAFAERTELYHTNFESFEVGVDTLVGTDEWLGTSAGQGAHGIHPTGSSGVGKSAYVGKLRPAPNVAFVSVRRPVTYEPLVDGETRGEVIEFYSLIGVADSSNGSRDNFYVSIYDTENRLLGAINFDNTQDRFGMYRYDGESYHRSPVTFVRGRVQELYVRINFATGRWSAELNSLPIFQEERISFDGKSRSLGAIATEWEITTAASPGNNWLLFDEWRIEAVVPQFEPTILASTRNLRFEWTIEAGYGYELQSSTDLQRWTEVPNIIRTEVKQSTASIALAEQPALPTFYRLERKVLPVAMDANLVEDGK